MLLAFEVYAVHNHLGPDKITWFSAFLRAITGSFFNHLAIRLYSPETGDTIGIIEAVWPRVKFWADFDAWKNHATRTVQPLTPADGRLVHIDTVLTLAGQNYGLLDLVQLLRVIVNRIWLGRAYYWNGRRGTGLRRGYTCSELAYTIAGLPDPHLAIPGDAVTNPAFVKGQIFTTLKV